MAGLVQNDLNETIQIDKKLRFLETTQKRAVKTMAKFPSL